jgi:hypothetical protein
MSETGGFLHLHFYNFQEVKIRKETKIDPSGLFAKTLSHDIMRVSVPNQKQANMVEVMDFQNSIGAPF